MFSFLCCCLGLASVTPLAAASCSDVGCGAATENPADKAKGSHLRGSNVQCGPRTARTAEDYVECWDKGQVCCVSDNLIGSVMAPLPVSTSTVYPENRSMAWFATSDDLETALQLRKKYGAGSQMITVGIQVAVGFNPVQTSWGDAGQPGFAWLIMEKPTGHFPLVASLTEWFQFLAGKGVRFDEDVVQQINATYTDLKMNGPPYDVVQAWSNLTGCSRRCSVPVTSDVEISEKCNCSKGAVDAFSVVKPWLDPETPGNDIQCLQKLVAKFPKPTAGQIRVALHACLDMLPVFTGVGVGYNTLVSPLKGDGASSCKVPVSKRYAGPEVILPNVKLSKLNSTGSARYINLTAVDKAEFAKLTNTFC